MALVHSKVGLFETGACDRNAAVSDTLNAFTASSNGNLVALVSYSTQTSTESVPAKGLSVSSESSWYTRRPERKSVVTTSWLP